MIPESPETAATLATRKRNIEHETYYSVWVPTADSTDARFTNRLIGVEFETGMVTNSRDLMIKFRDGLPHWGCHSDGSLHDPGAREFVTHPMSGKYIKQNVEYYFEIMKASKSRTHSTYAGMHVHVDAKELVEFRVPKATQALGAIVRFRAAGIRRRNTRRILLEEPFTPNPSHKRMLKAYFAGGRPARPKLGKKISDPWTSQHKECGRTRVGMAIPEPLSVTEDIVLAWGCIAVQAVRRMVSTPRRASSFCSDGFATRGYEDKHIATHKMNKLARGSYPTIAFRARTFEFRVWPSTAHVERALARIELSQKMVDFLMRLVKLKEKDAEKALDKFQKATQLFCRAHETSKQDEFANVIPLMSILGMSPEGVVAIIQMHAAFKAYEYTEVKFKFGGQMQSRTRSSRDRHTSIPIPEIPTPPPTESLLAEIREATKRFATL